MGRRPALFTEPDLARALKVLREQNLAGSHRVAIRPDGSIVIEPVEGPQQAQPTKPRLHLVREDDIAL